jgi:hypothetical protein
MLSPCVSVAMCPAFEPQCRKREVLPCMDGLIDVVPHAELLGVARTRWSCGNQCYTVFATNRPQPARHIPSARGQSPAQCRAVVQSFLQRPAPPCPGAKPNRAERRSPLGAPL